MSLFSSKAILERRRKVEEALRGLFSPGDLLLVFAGDTQQKPGGLDQTYDYLPHPEYLWLTGSRRAGGVVAYTQEEGWIDFVQPMTLAETLWEGGREKAFGRDLAEFESWRKVFSARRTISLGQSAAFRAHSKSACDQDFFDLVQEAVNRVRRRKDSEEIQLIRECAAMAQKGYQRIQEFLRAGVTEREIQIEYEAEVLRAGADKFPYGSIVGSGPHSAVLHAVPTKRPVQAGELLLVDAGADVQDYGVDITRMFSVGGQYDQRQKDLLDIVRAAQSSAIALSKPGVEWHDVHRCAARVLAEGLRSLNLLRGSVEDLTESGALALFFPHGIGHMVGLRVRDVGPRIPLNLRECCGVKVRVDFPLEEDFVMTVEPGVYFIPALLDRSETRAKFADQVHWTEVEKWKDFGGIRIEDDIRITSGQPENLTSFVLK